MSPGKSGKNGLRSGVSAGLAAAGPKPANQPCSMRKSGGMAAWRHGGMRAVAGASTWTARGAPAAIEGPRTVFSCTQGNVENQSVTSQTELLCARRSLAPGIGHDPRHRRQTAIRPPSQTTEVPRYQRRRLLHKVRRAHHQVRRSGGPFVLCGNIRPNAHGIPWPSRGRSCQ